MVSCFITLYVDRKEPVDLSSSMNSTLPIGTPFLRSKTKGFKFLNVMGNLVI